MTDHLFMSLGSYPIRAGNSVSLLIDGEPAFRRVCEAIEGAQQRVWATVTFMWPEFRMPDGRGSALDVLDRAARRGVDVRLIFWRPDEQTANLRRNAFWGAVEHFELLKRHAAGLSVRWDCAQPGYCQHQKSWLIDAGTADSRAFLGGLNLNPHSMVMPGHAGAGQNHDVYMELTGPAVADVEHNFVQRWNEASERQLPGGCWGENGEERLEFPAVLPPVRGDVTVQIQRTIHAGRYRDAHPAVGAPPYEIAVGEQVNFAQYIAAIHHAQRTIYLENQYLETPEVVRALHDALKRGVEVVVLLPLKPDLSSAPVPAERRAFLEARAALAGHEQFTLAGLAGLGADGQRKPVWIHSKLMLVDDAWATVGSANLHRYSMFGNAELNAALHSPERVRQFRVELFQEHLARDTTHLSDVQALRAFKEVATSNQRRFQQGDHGWEGLAIKLDMKIYGQVPAPGWSAG